MIGSKKKLNYNNAKENRLLIFLVPIDVYVARAEHEHGREGVEARGEGHYSEVNHSGIVREYEYAILKDYTEIAYLKLQDYTYKIGAELERMAQS